MVIGVLVGPKSKVLLVAVNVVDLTASEIILAHIMEYSDDQEEEDDSIEQFCDVRPFRCK
jgi:hypothetical protein